MRIPPGFPVIGTLFNRRLHTLTRRAVDYGDPEAVRELAVIARTGTPPERKAALGALSTLCAPDAIGEVCREVIERGDQGLEAVAVRCGYFPREPELRMLFLLVTGQPELLSQMYQGSPFSSLAGVYAAAPARIRNRILERSSDRQLRQILARALIKDDIDHSVQSWSSGDWELIYSFLAEEQDWDRMWTLAPSMPPDLAVRALNLLRNEGWKPEGDSRKCFEELLGDLPETWIPLVPESPLLSMGAHGSQCVNLAFSPDGTFLAAGYADGNIEAWEVSRARLVTSFVTQGGSIRFLAITPDNEYIISLGSLGTVSCFGIPAGDLIWSYKPGGSRITCLAISANGEDLFAGDDQGTMIGLGCRTGVVLFSVTGHSYGVTAISAAPDGTRIAAGFADGTICCRERSIRSYTWTVPGNGDAVRDLKFTNLGLAIFFDRALPSVREINKGERRMTCSGFSGYLVCGAVREKGPMIMAGSDRKVLRFWNPEGGKPAVEIPFYNRLPVFCAFTPDGTLAIAGCSDGTIVYLNIPGGEKRKEIRAYQRPVTASAVSPDGTLLATASGDGTVTLRSIPAAELVRTLRVPPGGVTGLSFVQSARRTGIVSGTADGKIRIFSPFDGALTATLDMYTHSVSTLAVSHDGKFLACGGGDKTLRLWDLDTGGLVATCENSGIITRCLAFLADGKSFISCGWDGIIRFWRVPDGALVKTLEGHSSNITCCCVDPRGTCIVTASNDTTLRIWEDAGEGRCIVIRDARKEILSCAISPDGTLLATAGSDPELRLYNFPDGTAAGEIILVPGKPTALSFTDDGLAIAVGYDNGTLALYSVKDRSLVQVLPGHAGAVTGIITMRGEDSLVSSGADGMIRVFRAPFLQPLASATLDDVTWVQELAGRPDVPGGTGKFLLHLLSLRFQGEIQICSNHLDAGIFDIQITG